MPDRFMRRGDLSVEGAPDKRSFRRSYLNANAFEFFAAVAAVLTGVAFFVQPDAVQQSAVGDQAGVIALFWALLYVLGGLSVFWGLVRPHATWELAGLSMFGSAAAIDALALITGRGPAGLRVALIYLAFAVASGLRASSLVKIVRASRIRDGG